MKTNTLLKTFLAAAISFASLASSACWYKYWTYNDYIFGINNFVQHTAAVVDNTNAEIEYMVTNNQVVDLPISVSINLEHNLKQNVLNGEKLALEDVTCKLQYRVLPNGKWEDVAEREFKPNTIPANALATFYLGRNNIAPKGLEKGDVIMIRLYVSRGAYHSGDLKNPCDDKLDENHKLPSTYQYKASGEDPDTNLGGGWSPHLVTTVIFSGNYRPVR